MKMGTIALGAMMAMGIAGVARGAQPHARVTTSPAATRQAATTRKVVTLINLHMPQASAEEVFDEMAKQGEVKFWAGDLWQKETMQERKDVDITDKPFWEAVREVCGMWELEAGQDFGSVNAGRRIKLNAIVPSRGGDASRALPVYESNGVMVEAISFNREHNVLFGSQVGPDHEFCNVRLKFYIDPAVHVVDFNLDGLTDEAVDDRGNSMTPGKTEFQTHWGTFFQTMIYDCNVRVKYPDDAGEKIARLKGRFQMVAADNFELMTIDKPLQSGAVSKKFGETTVRFQSLKSEAQDHLYDLTLSVTEGGLEEDYNKTWERVAMHGRLVDEEERLFSFVGGNEIGPEGLKLRYSRSGGVDGVPGKPVRWEIEIPTGVRVVDVPFELKDLALR